MMSRALRLGLLGLWVWLLPFAPLANAVELRLAGDEFKVPLAPLPTASSPTISAKCWGDHVEWIFRASRPYL